MSFRYFIPNVTREEFLADHVTHLKQSGLDGTFRDLLIHADENPLNRLVVGGSLENGPGGLSGVLFAARGRNGEVSDRIGHFPEYQEWHEAEKFWIAIDREDPPTPESLLRSEVIRGEEVKLGDGNVWIAPTIRRYGEVNHLGDNSYGGCNLPMIYTCDLKTRQFQERIETHWAWAWELSGQIFDWFFVKDSTAIPPAFLLTVAATCLSINYRVNYVECSLLELITSANYHRIFYAAIDGNLLLAFLKDEELQEELRANLQQTANDPDGPKKNSPPPERMSSSPGVEGISETTTPAGQNCTR